MRRIIWSNIAKIKLFSILEYYRERNKSNNYSKKLYKRFKVESQKLQKQPEIGIKTDYEAVRGLIVDDFILFYEITSEFVIIHTVWDCRQNPETLKIK